MSCPAVVPVHVVLAVKNLLQAKSRLADAVPAEQRAALVLAMLTDTLGAALRSSAVAGAHVVTRDAAVAATARHCGASVLSDPEYEGLNHALDHAATMVTTRPLCALQPDLPALRTGELDAALRAAQARGARCFNVDRHGSGTTMLVTAHGELHPLFGADSAARHCRSGAQPLSGAWPGLGCDVDTVADLAAALRMGVGPATGRVLDGLGTPCTVQEHGRGVVVLRTDDGHTLRGGDAAARLGGWRQLRPGQRVRALTASDATVALLMIPASTPPG